MQPRPPELRILHSLWGFEGSLAQAISRARRHGFDGLEVNVEHPALMVEGAEAALAALAAAGQALVLEVVTGNGYVPDLELSPQRHLQQLERGFSACRALQPIQVSVITGSDSWGWREQEPFWRQALALAEASGLPVSFETHRSRSLADPWRIERWLEKFPQLRLTADLSHWCCLSERLMTPDLAPIQAISSRVDHLHARVGHAQGPQVSHPFAPEHAEALEAHRRCWQLFMADARRRGRQPLTITPEFGPDGYMPTLPFTNQPVADLLEINSAMASWLRQGLPQGGPGGSPSSGPAHQCGISDV